MSFQLSAFRFPRIRRSFEFFLKAESWQLTARKSSGFTLIELLVVCAIMALVTALVMSNQGKFGGHVLLQNFAYDVALSIRQAQVYGISVQRSGTGAGAFGKSYGVHFAMTTPTTYFIFADQDKDGVYDPGEEIPPTYTISRGYAIQSLCQYQGSSSEVCTLRSLDILFQRPEPDALISWIDSSSVVHSCVSQPTQCSTGGRIVVLSPRGESMSVRVSNSGQIAVDQTIAE